MRTRLAGILKAPASLRVVLFISIVLPIVVRVLMGDLSPLEGIRAVADAAIGLLGG